MWSRSQRAAKNLKLNGFDGFWDLGMPPRTPQMWTRGRMRKKTHQDDHSKTSSKGDERTASNRVSTTDNNSTLVLQAIAVPSLVLDQDDQFDASIITKPNIHKSCLHSPATYAHLMRQKPPDKCIKRINYHQYPSSVTFHDLEGYGPNIWYSTNSAAQHTTTLLNNSRGYSDYV
jgi:hypothetical protein